MTNPLSGWMHLALLKINPSPASTGEKKWLCIIMYFIFLVAVEDNLYLKTSFLAFKSDNL